MWQQMSQYIMEYFTYVKTHPKFIRAIFCNVILHYHKLEFFLHKGVRNMFKKRVLLGEELNGKLRIVILTVREHV